MEQLLVSAIYEGVVFDLLFEYEQPVFGDLFQICGYDHPKFPGSGKFDFGGLSELGFEQVDDFFGITSNEDEGDDVTIWLYPLVDGEPVYHHSGPFSGVRLSFSILRNTADKGEFFLRVIEQFSQTLPVKVMYRLRNLELGFPPNLSVVRADINQIVEHWRSENIKPGSSEALQLNY